MRAWHRVDRDQSINHPTNKASAVDTEARKLKGRGAFDPRENMDQLVARRRSERVLDPNVQSCRTARTCPAVRYLGIDWALGRSRQALVGLFELPHYPPETSAMKPATKRWISAGGRL